MAETSIEWTEKTWNPVTGCDRISAGCDNCYALAMARRLKAMGAAKYQNDGDPRTSGPGFAVTTHPDVLTQPMRWRHPCTVFVNSMSDLFHARVPVDFIARVFEVMATTPRHTYQVLTKRAARLAQVAAELPWPPNVWMGVSVEDARQLHRVEHLRRVPAAVRFISAEPLLGPLPSLDLTGINWLIIGGESGPSARQMKTDWTLDLIDRAGDAGTAVFVKQLGSVWARSNGADGKGGDWSLWPEDLRIRQYPTPCADAVTVDA